MNAEGTLGNPNAIGDQGTAAGVGQWSNQVNGIPQSLQKGQVPINFQNDAKQYGLNPSDFSLENQKKVLYGEIASGKKAGLTPEQILSKHNSGDPNKYLNPATSTGSGPVGAYNVADYVKRGMAAAQQYAQTKKGNGYVTPPAPIQPQDQQAPAQTSGDPLGGFLQGLIEDATGTNPESIGTQLENTAKGVGNFLLPSVGDAYHDVTGTNTKTGLQQLGDLGTSALGVASILPGTDAIADPLEAARGADVGAGLVGKTLASNTAKNAALGAGYGISGAVGNGDTNLQSIGENAALGAAGGGILGKAGDVVGDAVAKKASQGAGGRLEQLNDKLVTVGNAFDKNSTKTTNPIKTLVDNGLTKDLKVVDGKVNIDALTNGERTGSIDNLIDQHSSQASDLVKTLKGGVPIEEFKNELISAAEKNPDIVNAGKVDSAEADINRRMASYKRSFGEVIPYQAIDGIRTAMNKVWSPDEVDVTRSIGDTARDYLYNGDGTNDAIKSAMANESELIKARNYVEKLKNRNVKGGQLQKYLADLGGVGVGGAVGKMFGPVGEGVGGLLGGAVTDKIMKHSQDRYFDPLLSKAAKNVSNASKSGAIRIAGKIAKGGALRALTSN